MGTRKVRSDSTLLSGDHSGPSKTHRGDLRRNRQGRCDTRSHFGKNANFLPTEGPGRRKQASQCDFSSANQSGPVEGRI